MEVMKVFFPRMIDYDSISAPCSKPGLRGSSDPYTTPSQRNKDRSIDRCRHTYIRTHTYILIYINTYIHTYIHTYKKKRDQ